MSTKKQQDLDREHDAAMAAFDLVRPGLATEDRGDIGDPLPADLGANLARIAAGEDPSASSTEVKRAKLQLPAWARQEQVLRGFEALGNLTAACESAGVSRKAAEHWRRTDSLGFAGRLENAKGGFGDRLEALAWDMVKRMKPGQNPTLLICLLNATLPLKYRPAVQVDPVAARDTLSELRQLASSGPGDQVDQVEDRGAAAVAEAERLLGARAVSEPGGHGESGKNGADAEHQDHRDQDPGPGGQELDPSGGG
jgi:hypothetical protein